LRRTAAGSSPCRSPAAVLSLRPRRARLRRTAKSEARSSKSEIRYKLEMQMIQTRKTNPIRICGTGDRDRWTGGRAKRTQFRPFWAENEGRAEKQSQSVCAGGPRLGIWDCGLGIRADGGAVCQTNPIGRGGESAGTARPTGWSGKSRGREMSNKANLVPGRRRHEAAEAAEMNVNTIGTGS